MLLKKSILKILFLAAIIHPVKSQVKIDGQFYNYTAYYLANFDLSTGQSDVPLFRYDLFADQYPVYAKIKFKASILSPALGLRSRMTLVEIESDPFEVKNRITIDNRNVNENTTSLIDQASPPNIIPITFRTLDSANPSDYESMISSVITSGRLADGEYRFELSIFSGSTKSDLSLSDQDIETIVVEAPSGVNLESPGGSISDTTFNVVYSPYPIFNWNKGFCRDCETYIRVSNFKEGYHSSLEDAVRDERLIPSNQALDWLKLDDISTYQYPIDGVRPLEYGNIYVWQVKVEAMTTNGKEEYVSSIYAFKLMSPSQSTNNLSKNVMLNSIRQAIGDEEFKLLFGPNGPFEDTKRVGSIQLNSKSIDQVKLQEILTQMSRQYFNIKSIQIEK